MFKNTLKRLGAIVLALAMAMSVMMVSAFAVDDEVVVYPTTQTINFYKQINKASEAYLPNATFEFELTPSTDKVNNTEKAANEITGGVVLTDGQIASAATNGGVGSTAVQINDDTGTLTVTASDFGQPGVYKYTLTEKAGTYADGTAYAGSSKVLYVYIIRQDGVLKVQNVYFGTGDDATADKDTEIFVNTYETKQLHISKTVEGLMGDKSKEFAFTLTITPADANKKFSYSTDGQNVQELTLTNGVYEFTLSDSEHLYVYGLAANDTWTVTEDSYAGEGYTTTVNGTTGLEASGNGTEDGTAAYVNTKGTTTPTGVIMNIAPYVLMVALAGGIAFFFLRRRHAE